MISVHNLPHLLQKVHFLPLPFPRGQYGAALSVSQLPRRLDALPGSKSSHNRVTEISFMRNLLRDSGLGHRLGVKQALKLKTSVSPSAVVFQSGIIPLSFVKDVYCLTELFLV